MVKEDASLLQKRVALSGIQDTVILPEQVSIAPQIVVTKALDTGCQEKPKRKISERELEVLTLKARGFTNKQIASELYIAPSTVKKHLENILSDLGYKTALDAIVAFIESGEMDTAEMVAYFNDLIRCEQLTDDEAKLLKALVKNRDIGGNINLAGELSINRYAVKRRIESILGKIGASNRTHAGVYELLRSKNELK